jgi:hypothetical protein
VGFVQRTTTLDFDIVTMSIWFRVPAASIAAAEVKWPTVANQMDRWRGLIPLITWGTQTSGTETAVNSVLLGTEPGIGDIFGQELGATTNFDEGPGYIGIRCDPSGDAVLDAYIPVGAPASCSAVRYIADGYEVHDPFDGGYDYTYSDISSTESGYDDWFGGESDTVILADTIYHLLISWDLTSGSASVGVIGGADPDVGVTASSTMYAAINDVNITGADLPMVWAGGAAGVNTHVSRQTYQFAGLDENPIGLPGVTTTASGIPTDPVSVPGPASINLIAGSDEPVLKVQIGDLQVFTGIALDTSIEENRRAFITSGGRPASPALAAALMDKQPEIRFQTVNDWQVGNNRGTDGDFTATGTITGVDFDFG